MRNENGPTSRLRSTPPGDRALAELAAGQYGVVGVARLDSLGLDSSAVRKRVRAGRLHRVFRGVYAVGHSALSQEAIWMAAALTVDGYVSRRSAARLWGVWRGRVAGVDVVARTKRRAQPGLRVHTCPSLDARDVTRVRGIPATTIPRTLVDLADEMDANRLANVIHEAAFKNMFDAQETRAAMARSPGRRLSVLERALREHERGSAGTRSNLEDRFLSLFRAAGLPEPSVNTRVKGIEVDFHWPRSRLCVEIDGPGHERPRTQREDAQRDQTLEHANQTVLRFRREDLDRPEHVTATVTQRLDG